MIIEHVIGLNGIEQDGASNPIAAVEGRRRSTQHLNTAHSVDIQVITSCSRMTAKTKGIWQLDAIDHEVESITL